MKILTRIVLGLLALLVVALIAVFVFIDPLLAEAIERGATYGTGVETKLGSVDAGLFSGELGLNELSVANPPGFRDEPFLEMKTGRAQWDNSSIMSDKIHIGELVFDGVEMNIERAGDKTNYGAILANLEKLSSKEKDEPEPAGPQKTIHIELIEIRNVKAGLHLTGTPIGKGSMTVDIPKITIEKLDSSGDTKEIIAKVTRAVLQAILQATLKAGKNIFPDDLLKDLGGSLEDLGKGTGKVIEDIGKSVEGALEGATDVFKKKK